MNPPLHAIHLLGRVGPQSFGLGTVAASLASLQSGQGCHTSIWCQDSPSNVAWCSRTFHLEPRSITSFQPWRIPLTGYSPSMEHAARHAANQGGPLVAHQHSIWTGISRVTEVFRSRMIATVVAAHGALQPWALRRSRWKKELALRLYERRNLSEASCLHACGANEVDDYRNFGLRNPVALLPNAISDDWLTSAGDAANFRKTHAIADDQRIILYLSRITPKKGLPMLLDALAALPAQRVGWTLVIAGVDEFGHTRELSEQVSRLGLQSAVRFTGPVFNQMKRDAFAAASLFVLPSYSEGSPMVVLEALGASVPVLTTKGTPWSELQSSGCGWWTDIETSAIGAALEEALSLSPSELALRGARSRSLVATKYNWATVASQTIEMYNWLNGVGSRPGFILT